MPESLHVTIGEYTSAGIKPFNEDSIGSHVPDEHHQLTHKGVCAFVADGVSTAEAGKQASELSIHQFITDYYKTPDTWSVEHAGQQILAGINSKLYRLSDAYRVESKGFLCTFSGVVVKSRTAHVFHVGDSRVYLLRAGELKAITHDHCAYLSKNQLVLSRAVGMDSQIHVDYTALPIENGDVILCTSDGVHDFLDHSTMTDILNAESDVTKASEALYHAALEAGSDDNISAVLMRIDQVSDENIDDFNARLTRLPFPPELEPGMNIDGLHVLEEIYASSRSQLYRVQDIESGKVFVMKTPSINFEEDNHYIDRFIQEEWIGQRIHSPYVVEVVNLNREKHFLYYLMESIDGQPLSQWIKHNPMPHPTTAMNIIEQIAEGLKAFHRNDTTHQDLRPSNIMINEDNKLKIVDFGSVYVAGIAEVYKPIVHDGALGTASYADPLYLQGKNPGTQGDLFSLGVMAYELFTHHLPYGSEVEECTSGQDFDRLRYKSANKYNAIVPMWFDRALEKSVKFDLQERYRTIREFIQDLKYPNPEFLRDDPKQEFTKSPLLFWQMMSLFWILMIFIMVALFSS